MSVAVLEAQLAGRRAAREHVVEHPPASGEVVRMDDRGTDGAEELRRLTSQHGREGRVALDDLDAAVVVDPADDHADGSRGECRLEERARRGQLARDPLAVGDVERHTADSDDPVLGVADRELQRPDVTRLARARIGHGLVEAHVVTAAQHLAVVGRELRVDLRRNGLRELLAEQLLGCLAEDAADLGVGHDPALIGVAHVDRRGAVVENRLQPAAGVRPARLRPTSAP